MEKKKLVGILAVTVMTVPLIFTGCGKGAEEVPTTDAVVESVVETVVESAVETIEADLANEGIEVTPTIEAEEAEEVEEVDTSPIYVTTMLTVGEIDVYAEADETAEVIGMLPKDTEVSVLGILHESDFFQVQYDEETVAYIRTVDLCDLWGEYDEKNNLSENETADFDPSILVTDSSGLTDEEWIQFLAEHGFEGASLYDPSKDTECDLSSKGLVGARGGIIQ